MAAVGTRLGRGRTLVLAAVCLLAVAAAGGAQTPSDNQVKAAYLYGFGRFVDWPATAPAEAGEAFVLCVLGNDPFGRVLDDIAANAVRKDKPVRIQRIVRVEESRPCHTLFISSSEDVHMAGILEALDHQAMLTVSDAPQFAQRGGMIGFSIVSSRVRFSVNVGAAQAAGLSLNSELLRVATTVIGARRTRE